MIVFRSFIVVDACFIIFVVRVCSLLMYFFEICLLIIIVIIYVGIAISRIISAFFVICGRSAIRIVSVMIR